MSNLNPRAIATLGVGFGPTLVAYLGLWPVDVAPPVDDFGPLRGGAVIQQDYRHGFRDDRELLELMPIIVEVLNGRR